MNESRKRNIIIASLCGVLLLMAVGYAAFQSVLNIEGTANITSNWDIKITNIVEKEHVGSAESAEEPTHEDLTATFSVNLVSPGDSISYDVTIENQGNLDAELARIKVNKGNNPAIKFETSGIEEGSTLEASGGSAILTVKITYDESITSQPEDTGATFKVTLDYVQKDHKSEWIPSDAVNVGGQYVDIVDDGSDGLYADPNPEESGRYVYRGADPDNYITFNGEEAGWRIISIESNGELKIMRASSMENKAFDTNGKRTTGYCSQGNATSYGCNVWALNNNFVNGTYSGAVDKDSEMKTYLNGTYYNTITTNKDKIVTNHIWYYGGNLDNESSLSTMITNEKKYSANSNVGLISPSDYIKANSNTSQCGTAKLHYDNRTTCKSTNWMTYSNWYWTLSPTSAFTDYMLAVSSSGHVSNNSATAPGSDAGVVPSLYLKSTIKLSGSGTQDEPYTISLVE